MIYYASIAGVLLSLYALYVEHQKAENDMFVAMCDINSWVACSKYVVVLLSALFEAQDMSLAVYAGCSQASMGE